MNTSELPFEPEGANERTSRRGLWSWPGGQQEVGRTGLAIESPARTAIREVQEETGYLLKSCSEPVYIESHKIDAGKHAGKVATTFAGVSTEFVQTESNPDDEVDAIGWFPLESVGTMPNATKVTYQIASRLPQLIAHPALARERTSLPVLR